MLRALGVQSNKLVSLLLLLMQSLKEGRLRVQNLRRPAPRFAHAHHYFPFLSRQGALLLTRSTPSGAITNQPMPATRTQDPSTGKQLSQAKTRGACGVDSSATGAHSGAMRACCFPFARTHAPIITNNFNTHIAGGPPPQFFQAPAAVGIHGEPLQRRSRWLL